MGAPNTALQFTSVTLSKSFLRVQRHAVDFQNPGNQVDHS
jgi:hypothetical protein